MSSPSISKNQAIQNNKKSSTLKRGIIMFAGLIVVTFAGVTIASVYRHSNTEISSENHRQLTDARDLVAEISPAPALAVSAYVDVLQANSGRADVAATFETFRQREQNYLARVEYWKNSTIPANIKQTITADAPAALADFWQQSKDIVFPILMKDGARSAVDTSKLNAALMKIETSFDNHKQVIAGASGNARQYLDTQVSKMQAAENFSAWLSTLLLAALGLMIAAAIYFTGRSILAPLKQLARQATGLSNGEDMGEIPVSNRSDEIADISNALFSLKNSAVNSLNAQQLVNEEREHASKLTEEATTEREMREAETAKAVQLLGNSLNRMANGDFTASVDTPFTGELEKLRNDMNATLAQISNTFGRIVNTTDNLGTGVQEIVTASDDLSMRTERQAASLEQTSATLTQITATVQKSSEGAKHTKDVVEIAKKDAKQSGTVVEKALSAMAEIEKSAKEINQIITVIDEIAFQTNLLALNAGVEAARAGDAGQGFAVVASEVRALAQRSAEAAKEIKGLISKSSEQVKDGSHLVGKTGETLHRIADQVIQISDVVDQIASGADEQFQSLNELNIAVSDLDSGTQQNAAMAEQATAACHSLKAEANELSNLIRTFKVSGSGRAAPRMVAPTPAPVRPAPAPVKHAPAAAKPVLRKTVASAKPVAINGNTTAQHKPAPSPANNLISKVSSAFSAKSQSSAALQDDDWTEF